MAMSSHRGAMLTLHPHDWIPALVLRPCHRRDRALLGANFDGEQRGRAIGAWAVVGAIAGAIGPLAVSELIDLFGWSTIFLIDLPLAALTLMLCARALPHDAPTPAQRHDLAGGIYVELTFSGHPRLTIDCYFEHG